LVVEVCPDGRLVAKRRLWNGAIRQITITRPEEYNRMSDKMC